MMGDLKENFVELIDVIRAPYFGDLETIRTVNIDLIRDKIKKSAFLTSKTGVPYYLRCVVSDRENLDQIKKIEKAVLLEISPNLSTISQYANLVSDSGKEEQLELIIKGIRGGDLIRKTCSGKESLLPLIWYDNLFLLLNGPFVQINDSEKAKILKNNVLPFYNDLNVAVGENGEWLEELKVDCLSLIYVFEGNFLLGYKEIEKLKKSRLARFSEKDKPMVHPACLRLKLLMKEKKYETVISEFKSLPEKWLDFEAGDKLSMLIFSRIAADAYLELGKVDLSMVWRESAITLLFLVEFKSGKDLALEEATKLRSLYLKEKSWTLMRNLEERCAKFGMKPLPKQVGEN
jgi:hypothetical protein